MMTPGIGDEIVPPKQGDESKLKKLEDKLYSPNAYLAEKPRKELHAQTFAGNTSWNDGGLDGVLANREPEKKRVNFFAIMALIAFVFFASAAGYAGWRYMNGGQFLATSDVELTVIGPTSIGGGEELALDILVQNNGKVPLETVDLVIEYPEGTKQANDLKTDLPRLREGLGTIEPGALVKRTHAAALFGEEGVMKEIKVRVEYRLAGSNAIFSEPKSYELVLQSSPIRLVVDTVKEVTPGQELSFDVSLSSNSEQELTNILLTAQYPFGFTFSSATVKPTSGNNVWALDTLKPKETRKFTVKGQLQGQDGEDRIFKWNAGIADTANPSALGITFTSLAKAVALSQPFIGLMLSIEGDTNPVLVKSAGDALDATLTFKNNTTGNIRDAEIILSFSGDVLDKESVELSEGFYRSSSNTILWDSSVSDQLGEIEAGKSGVVTFSFKPRALSSQSTIFTNPEILMNIKASGTRVSEREVDEVIESTAFRRIKFLSDVVVEPVTAHLAGPVPPSADATSVYSVTLQVSNSSNDIADAKITFNLPSYVEWQNVIMPATEKVTYDQVTRMVEWTVGAIAPHTGYSSAPRQLTIQLAFEPSVSQVGTSPSLIRNVYFSGRDVFAGQTIDFATVDATIELKEDGNSANDRVVD